MYAAEAYVDCRVCWTVFVVVVAAAAVDVDGAFVIVCMRRDEWQKYASSREDFVGAIGG